MRKMWGLRFISALLIAVLLLSELKVTAFAGEVEIVEFEEETENVYNSEESLIDETFTEIGQSASDTVSEEGQMVLETFSDDENEDILIDVAYAALRMDAECLIVGEMVVYKLN